MASKRSDKGKQVAESARSRKRGSTRSSNPHKIVFEDDTQAKWYSTLMKWKITLSRYMCERTLSTLGLKSELDRMFHSIGLLDFMQREKPTYERTTLEFLSTLDFKLCKIRGLTTQGTTIVLSSSVSLTKTKN